MLEALGELPVATIILAVIVMAVGSALQAAVGMGLAMFVVPLLVIVDARFVPGPLQLAAIALALAMAYRERAAIDWSALSVALGGLLGGTVVGALALTAVDGAMLPRVVGGLILLAVLASVSGVAVRSSSRALLAAGAVSGVTGAMVGIHGPPIALVLQGAEPERVRAMLAGFFAVGYVAAVVALTGAGLFGREQLALGLLLTPGAIVGYLLGSLLTGWLDRGRLRLAILTISGISAVGLLLR